MKLFFKHTATLLLASIFLMSFTGMRLLLHHCAGCESTHYALLPKHQDECCKILADYLPASSCCSLPAENHANNSTTSCETNEEPCCIEEIIVVIHEYEVIPERPQIRVMPEVVNIYFTITGENRLFFSEKDNTSCMRNYGSPPCMPTGKAFVIFSHQLKTDHFEFQV